MTDCISPDASYALKLSRKYVLNIFLNLISAAGSLFVSFYHENDTLNLGESVARLRISDSEFQTSNFRL